MHKNLCYNILDLHIIAFKGINVKQLFFEHNKKAPKIGAFLILLTAV